MLHVYSKVDSSFSSTNQADLLGLSTPPTSQPHNSSNTGVLLDVLGDIYSKPNNVTAQNSSIIDPKK